MKTHENLSGGSHTIPCGNTDKYQEFNSRFPQLFAEVAWQKAISKYILISRTGAGIAYGLDGPGIESRWGARFSVLVQTGPEAHSASYAMGAGSFPGAKRIGRGVNHPPHLAPRLRKEYS
jgi:hypothetical protein